MVIEGSDLVGFYDLIVAVGANAPQVRLSKKAGAAFVARTRRRNINFEAGGVDPVDALIGLAEKLIGSIPCKCGEIVQVRPGINAPGNCLWHYDEDFNWRGNCGTRAKQMGWG